MEELSFYPLNHELCAAAAGSLSLILRPFERTIPQDVKELVEVSGKWQYYHDAMNTGSGLLEMVDIRCPYGRVGDRLLVKETWRPMLWGKDFDWMFVGYESGGRRQIDPVKAWGDKAQKVWAELAEECKARQPCKSLMLKWRSPDTMPRAAVRYALQIDSVKAMRLHDVTREVWRCYTPHADWGSNPWVWAIAVSQGDSQE